jgi:hypothetical protein
LARKLVVNVFVFLKCTVPQDCACIEGFDAVSVGFQKDLQRDRKRFLLLVL